MTEIRYEIRAVVREDGDRLHVLAKFLDSVNLPDDSDEIALVAAASEKAFSGDAIDPPHRQYVFVIFDLEADRAVGTSMILGQLGRRDAPYIYFDVLTEEKYSPTFDRHFKHPVLSIGYSFDGPTEIGGLVMDPAYRREDEKLGLLISYVRFLFIATHREAFRDQLLAELMPPLEEDGRSLLWEAIGHHFTGLTYREADRLSKRNKEFIRALFPDGDIYASLLPEKAQAVIGEVGRETRGVKKMLKRIGFRYAKRVDPFDGGPHFVAHTDDVVLVQRTVSARVAIGDPTGHPRSLVAREYPGPPWFRAVAVPALVREGTVTLSETTTSHLGLAEGDVVSVLPVD